MQRKLRRRTAFTLTELAIVVVVVGILTVAALPDRTAQDQMKLDAAMSRLEADIEYARTVALTSPADPTVIKVDLENDYYWIAKASDPNNPITNPSTRKPYVVVMGSLGDAGLRDVNITADNLGTEHALFFDGSGGVKSDTSLGMQFQIGTSKAAVKVSPSAATTQRVMGDLASIGVSNVVTEPPNSGGSSGGGVLGGILGGLGL